MDPACTSTFGVVTSLLHRYGLRRSLAFQTTSPIKFYLYTPGL